MGVIHDFDTGVVLYLNTFAHKSPLISRFITDVLNTPSAKFLPIVTCLVCLWFHQEPNTRQRSAAKQAVIGSFLALIIARLTQNLSPYRPRPIHSEELNISPPNGVSADLLREWSSFPSDNTALAFALAVGIAFGSKVLGAFCLIWATFIVAIPRIYGGLHYPTDVLGGALIGTLSTLICFYITFSFKFSASQIFSNYKQRFSSIYYGILFVTLFQITTLFNDMRRISSGLFETVKRLF